MHAVEMKHRPKIEHDNCMSVRIIYCLGVSKRHCDVTSVTW